MSQEQGKSLPGRSFIAPLKTATAIDHCKKRLWSTLIKAEG